MKNRSDSFNVKLVTNDRFTCALTGIDKFNAASWTCSLTNQAMDLKRKQFGFDCFLDNLDLSVTSFEIAVISPILLPTPSDKIVENPALLKKEQQLFETGESDHYNLRMNSFTYHNREETALLLPSNEPLTTLLTHQKSLVLASSKYVERFRVIFSLFT